MISASAAAGLADDRVAKPRIRRRRSGRQRRHGAGLPGAATSRLGVFSSQFHVRIAFKFVADSPR
jgi:hypothetical protein